MENGIELSSENNALTIGIYFDSYQFLPKHYIIQFACTLLIVSNVLLKKKGKHLFVIEVEWKLSFPDVFSLWFVLRFFLFVYVLTTIIQKILPEKVSPSVFSL